MSDEPRVHLSRSARPAYRALAAFTETVDELADGAQIDARLKEIVQIHTSQLNGCAFCARIHVDRALKAGVGVDEITQIPTWRESGVFTERERAGLELAESWVYIHEEGVPDDVYDRVGAVFSEAEYVALSWILVSINAFNRVAIAGRYDVSPREAVSS